MSTTTAAEDEEVTKARQEAEARRQRILDGAEGRMGIVNGEQTADQSTSATSEAAEKPKSSSAAKMAAMRRRRFNKGVAAKKAAGQEEEDEEPTAAAAVNVKEAVVVETVVEEEEDTIATTATTNNTTEEDASSGKKYMGVAKMRRRKLKEKAAAAAAAEEAESSQSATTTTLAAAPKKKKKAFVDRLSILMHAVTVLLMFGAGLDIGFQQQQQQQNDYGDSGFDLVVHMAHAPKQHGLAIVSAVQSRATAIQTRVLQWTMPAAAPTTTIEKVTDIGQEENNAGETIVVEKDEFATTGAESGMDDDDIDDTPDNLDPLFGMDLDKITKGPGIVLFLARRAIFLHRINLNIFYYMPRKIVFRITGVVQQLITTPPIMCLVALVCRQLIGKVLLGAKLPDKVTDDKKHKDIMSTVKNMVKAFVLTSFPTAVSMYDAWGHLRSDMYVVLCGVFVAVVWNHYVTESHALDQEAVGGGAAQEILADTGITGDEL